MIQNANPTKSREQRVNNIMTYLTKSIEDEIKNQLDKEDENPENPINQVHKNVLTTIPSTKKSAKKLPEPEK